MRLANVLPTDRNNCPWLVAFVMLWAISCIAVPYPEYFVMQHVPTVVAVVGLVIAERKQLIDRLGFAMIVGFLMLHLLGARYLYSFVPYDDWTQHLFGVRVTDYFEFRRNHYDRLVHFCFGLLFVYPLWRFFERRLGVMGWWPAVLAVCMVLAAGAVYEICEWLTAMTFAPDWADAYNGQQGDVWDAERDMAIAALGSLIAVACIGFTRRLAGEHRAPRS